MTIVVDASVLVSAAVDTGAEGIWAEDLLATGVLVAPIQAQVEATNILRRWEAAQLIDPFLVDRRRQYLMGLDLTLLPFLPFADRVWELRSNLTSYDAWYVAVAESLDAPLATLDRKLARAPGPTCPFFLPE